MAKKPATSKEITVQEDKPGPGRPTLYKPEYCERAYNLCLLGATDDELAAVFDVSTVTLNAWKKAHPEFGLALREGKILADAKVARSLYDRANGYTWVEEQAIKIKDIEYDANGKKIRETERVEIVPVTRRAPPDTTAGIYWSKNRRPQDWRDRKEVEIGRPGEFEAKSTEELVDYIIGEAKELGLGLPAIKAPNTKETGTKH